MRSNSYQNHIFLTRKLRNYDPIKQIFFQCPLQSFSILRWCRTQDLFGEQIPVTTGGFELRISCIRSNFTNFYQ